jgi:hypothetical protein
LKNLKDAKKDPEQLDRHDLSNFYKFFKRLYSTKPKVTVPEETVSSGQNNFTHDDDLTDLLNGEISIDELNNTISRLKLGKAVSEDCISNEFLCYSNTDLRLAIMQVFIQCLKICIFPGNISIVTPLRKKGDQANPNKYRAIAAGSAIGKLSQTFYRAD